MKPQSRPPDRRSARNHRAGKNQPKGGSWLPKWKRLAILIRDRFQCLYCGRDLRDAGPRQIHIDHIVCRERGGKDTEDNLGTSCCSCNCSKQHKPCEEFATPAARRRIRRQLAKPLNEALAREIIAGKRKDPRTRKAARPEAR